MPLIKGSAPKSDDTDPNFKDVSLLIQPEAHHSEDEVSYNVFNDASSKVTRIDAHGSNGDESDTRPVGTGFSPYEKNGYYSVEFGETVPYIKIPSQTYLYPQAGDFSFECFIYWKIKSGTSGIFGFSGGGGGTAKFMFILEPTGRLHIHTNGFGTQSWYSGDYRLPEKKWTFLCFRKTDGNVELFADGKSVASSSWTNVTINASVEWRIGYNGESSQALNGFLSNVRWRVGTISDGSMPSKPLTHETGTKILACLGNNFNDQSIELAPSYEVFSTQAFSPAVRTFNPFNINSRLFSPDGYHSVHFDGNDYLSIPNHADFQFGTGDFTVSFWIYIQYKTGGGIYCMTGGTTGYFAISHDSNGLIHVQSAHNNADIFTTSAPTRNRWHFMECSRASGTIRLFVDGALQKSVSNSTNFNGTAGNLDICNHGSEGQMPFFMSNLRVQKGVGITTSTVPTLPLENTSSTGLLCLQSTTIIDNSASQHTITANGTEPDAITNAFNPYRSDNDLLARPDRYFSTDFVGTNGNNLAVTPTSAIVLDGALTVEFWFKADTIVADGESPVILSFPTNGTHQIYFQINVTNKYLTLISGVDVVKTSNDVITTGKWYHVALGRDGSNNVSLWLNGTRVSTKSGNWTGYSGVTTIGSTSGNVLIGSYSSTSGAFNGCISNVRVVKGTDIYGVANTSITVPTTPLTAVTNTGLLTCQSYGVTKDNSSSPHIIAKVDEPFSSTSIPFSEPTATEVVTRETIKVTVASIAGGNKFLFNNESVASKTLAHMSGVTYRFDLSDSTTATHPFKLSETIDGSHSKQDGYYATAFDGTEGLLTSHHPDFHFSHNDYTVEFWVYPTTTGLKCLCGDAPSNGAGASTSFQIYKDANEYVVIYSDGGAIATSGVALAQNTWTHVAVVRQSGTVRIYQGGVQRQTATDDYNAEPSEYFAIGQTGAFTSSAFVGSISNFHIINGHCKYPDGTTYTPPTTPTQPHAMTVLLCCQSSSLNQDNSGLNKPLEERATPTTGTTTVPFSSVPDGSIYSTNVTVSGTQGQSGAYLEYKPTTSTPDLNYYCTAHSGMGGKIINGEDYTRRDVNDGSMYNTGAVGSHAQAHLVNAIGTGDFQISLWIYGQAFASNDYVISFRGSNESVAGAFGFGVNATGYQVMYTAGYQLNAGSIMANEFNWNFIQLRRKGTTCYVKMNGKQAGSFTYSDNISRTIFGIGGNSYTNYGDEFQGHIADVKVESASGLDRVPTIPRTADSNTEMLTCQFSGGARNTGMIDKAFPSRQVKYFNEEVSLSSFSPYLPDGYWSLYLGATDNYYVKLSGDDFAFGTSDFQIEMFIRLNIVDSIQDLYDSRSGAGSNKLRIRIQSNNTLIIFNTGTTMITGSTALAVGRWYHVCLSRLSGTTRLFLDGSQEGSDYSDSASYVVDTDRPVIGVSGYTLGNNDFKGYISNLRVKKGSGVSSVTVPTSPLESDSKTVFLGFQSNRLINNATYGKKDLFIKSGHPKCLFESPFNIDSQNFPYSKENHGGSISFDGGNDGVQIQNRNFDEFDMMNTHSFCFEYWVYIETYPTGWKRHWEQDGSLWSLRYLSTSGILALDHSPSSGHGSNVQDNESAKVGEWIHYAITHDLENNKTLRMFRNGVKVDEQTNWTQGWASGSAYTNYLMNKYFGSWGYSLDGYFCDLRFTRNEPVYTENFIPRTSPATLSSEVRNQANVKMLYNFDNAGIYDQSGRMTFSNFEQDYSGNNSKTVMVSSSRSKNGLGSLFFDEGTTLRTRMNQESVNILTGEFTIEFFVYFLNNPNTTNQSIVRNTGSFIIQRYGNEWEVGNEPTPQIQVAQSLSSGQWYYLALTRNSSNLLRLYAGAVTGTTVSSLGTASDYELSVSSDFYFGSYGQSGGSRSLKGYIDQLRITRANRYGTDSSIDVPTELFPRR